MFNVSNILQTRERENIYYEILSAIIKYISYEKCCR